MIIYLILLITNVEMENNTVNSIYKKKQGQKMSIDIFGPIPAPIASR